MITPLKTSSQATFGATFVVGTGVNARASLVLGPSVFGTSWHVDRISTHCVLPNSINVDVYLYVYRNTEDPTNLIDTTDSAALGDSDTNANVDIGAGENLLFVWVAQKDPGANASAYINLDGTVDNKRR